MTAESEWQEWRELFPTIEFSERDRRQWIDGYNRAVLARAIEIEMKLRNGER